MTFPPKPPSVEFRNGVKEGRAHALFKVAALETRIATLQAQLDEATRILRMWNDQMGGVSVSEDPDYDGICQACGGGDPCDDDCPDAATRAFLDRTKPKDET